MTVGKKKDGRRKRTVGEEVWREKKRQLDRKDSRGKKTVGREKTAQKSEERDFAKRQTKRKPVGRVHKNTDVETLI